MNKPVSICLPSRGLVHSRTVEHLLRNIVSYPGKTEVLMTHDKPIPDCFNALIDSATGEYIWFVEEDMGFPDNALARLVATLEEQNADAIAVDYPLGDDGSGHCLTYRTNQNMMLAGTGCTLIKTDVVKSIAPLRSDVLYHGVTMEPLSFEKEDNPYGKHDIYLFRELHVRGYKVIREHFDAWHYILDAMGDKHVNNGCHDIRSRKFV